jgi:hypothetical protein
MLNTTREYSSWHMMNVRCRNPNFIKWRYYGGRGITVCEEWRGRGGFKRFLAHMGRRPLGTSLDRIDNDKGYFPGNCRWATQTEQNRNSRKALKITFWGMTLCLRQWATVIGLTHTGLRHRLVRLPIEQALTRARFQRR